MLTLPLHLELGAVVVGALSGGLHGVRRGTDAIGVFSLAFSTGVGGGILRDVLLGHGPPVALKNTPYLLTVAVAALLAWLFASWLLHWGRALETVDAVLLGLWVVLGLEKALVLGLPVPSAVFLGVITSVGGGVMRDLLSGERPVLFVPGTLYATPAFLAALLYVGLVRGLALHPRWGETAAITFAAALRLVALHRGWTLPDPPDLRAWWERRRNPRD